MDAKGAKVEQSGAGAVEHEAGAGLNLPQKESKEVFYDVQSDNQEDQTKSSANPLLGIGLNQVPGATTAKKSKDAALAATTAVLQQKEAMEGRINRLPVCIQCFLCCCCWTGTGLLELLTDEETIQFALGFIIGEAFGSIINSVVSNLVSPVVVALGSPGWTLGYKNGYVIIANPGMLTKPEDCNTEETSFDVLVQECDIVSINLIGQNGLLTDLLQFVIIMVTVYWIVRGLRSARDRKFLKEKQEKPKEKECIMCFSAIHLDARRCPHCTSFQSVEDEKHAQTMTSSMLEISTEIQELKYLLLKKQ